MMKSVFSVSARSSCVAIACAALAVYSADAPCWGLDGHTAVGVIAIQQLQPQALHELESIVDPLTTQAVEQACNWPDVLRETDAGKWSSPLHYVNIPRGEESYSTARDCPLPPPGLASADRPGRFCVTESIKFFATELADTRADEERRWQAFAWLCHLVGDLHQPLHAGYGDDRGGNDVEVVFNDEPIELHEFWDSALIGQQAGSWQYLVGELGVFPPAEAGSGWSPSMVDDWTTESHNLDRNFVYTAPKYIDAAYAQQSWEVIEQQIRLAGQRLATIINHQLQAVESRNPSETPAKPGH
jgi:hypothetical protein